MSDQTTEPTPEPTRHVILTENARFGPETGAGIMRNRCAFTSRDMSADWPEAFTYAIVTGWDTDPEDLMEGEEDGAMDDVAAKFDWDDELVAFLRETHERFKALANKRTAPSDEETAAVPTDEDADLTLTRDEIRDHARRIITDHNVDYSYSLVYEDDELEERTDDDMLAVHDAMNKARVHVTWDN
jgi:hypothetical protein